jgi:hypothetical protein
MNTLRTLGQFNLNHEPLQGMYNITNSILVEHTKEEGVSYWFDRETKDMLLRCSDSEFLSRAKQYAGNNINGLEVAQSLWSELGDIPIDENEDLDVDFVTPFITFEKGTPNTDVWHWFESCFNLSVAIDLMNLK